MVEMDVSLICKALGDSNRLRIVVSLLEGEMCACRLLEQFSITQPTLSHHMKVLCDCDLVNVRKEGKWRLMVRHPPGCFSNVKKGNPLKIPRTHCIR